MYCITQFCCICLHSSKSLINLYDLDIDKLSFYAKLEVCSPSMISAETGKQPYICAICCCNLKIAYEFHTTCAKSKLYLNKYIFELENASSGKGDTKNLLVHNFRAVSAPKSTETHSLTSGADSQPETSFDNITAPDEINSFELYSAINLKMEPFDEDENSISHLHTSIDIMPDNMKCEADLQQHVSNDGYASQYIEPPTSSGTPPPTSSGTPPPAAAAAVAAADKAPPRVKRFVCDACSKAYRSRHDLKVHTRVHTGARPYECTVCHKRLKHSGSLKEHMRTHTGERPFVCTVCSRGFTNASNLKKHTAMHKTPKRCGCKYCENRYDTIDNLRLQQVQHCRQFSQFCAESRSDYVYLEDLNPRQLTHKQ